MSKQNFYKIWIISQYRMTEETYMINYKVIGWKLEWTQPFAFLKKNHVSRKTRFLLKFSKTKFLENMDYFLVQNDRGNMYKIYHQVWLETALDLAICVY